MDDEVDKVAWDESQFFVDGDEVGSLAILMMKGSAPDVNGFGCHVDAR